MDGAGRFSGSLIARLAGAGADAFASAGEKLRSRQRRAEALAADRDPFARPGAVALFLRRLSIRITNLHLPPRAGLAASLALFALTGLYGVHRGGHWPAVNGFLIGIGDTAANAAGMQVRGVKLTGNRQMTHDQILDVAGIGPSSSVLFFDPDTARARLKANAWIADATIQKLYPDQLLVSVVEREPFALWQRDGRIHVIAADGTVILDHLDSRFQGLPLLVGKGAETRAREIVGLLGDHPHVTQSVRAAVLVAERRWNLVLKNGIDVRLPDDNLDRAMADLARLDAERRLMSRDVASIDLRVPDRVTVRLSEDAMKAHEAALRERDRERARRRAAQGQRT
jgi:cell division protein FtsQ